MHIKSLQSYEWGRGLRRKITTFLNPACGYLSHHEEFGLALLEVDFAMLHILDLGMPWSLGDSAKKRLNILIGTLGFPLNL